MESIENQPSDLDLIGAIVVELDPRARITRYNRAASMFFGARDGELLGIDFFDNLVTGPSRRESRAAFKRALGGQITERELVESVVLDAKHEPRPLFWKIAQRRDPETHTVMGLVYATMEVPDASDRARLASIKELRDVKHALDASTIVAITDTEGTITSVNDKFCEVSKYSREELIGKNHRILNSGHHPKEFFKQMWATIARGKIWQGDIKNRAKDGTEYWVSTTIVPFFDDHGKPVQYVALRHEITARKRAEEALVEANRRVREEQMKLIQAEKLSSIGLLAAGIAHEVNNPLSGVFGCIKAVRDQKSMTEARREEYIATAMEGLERIQMTMRGLLDFSRQRATAPERIEVAEVVAAGLRLTAPALKKKELPVETSIAPIDLAVHADRGQVLQALVNVLLNAIYASPERQSVHVSASERGGRAAIEVRDRGQGIPPELLGRVCDPFFTTKPEGEGTGLGLAVTLGLLRANHGDLEIESEVGAGTAVRLLLPKER